MRRSCKLGDYLYITYGDAVITPIPYKKGLIDSMEDVMYFYYDIALVDKNKVVFESSAYDFPKVEKLPSCIDYIINMKEDNMFVYEDYKDGGFHRKRLYNFITLDDGFDMEYFYKIERWITYVKQSSKEEYKRFEEYILTIGKNERNREGYSNGEDFGKSYFINNEYIFILLYTK